MIELLVVLALIVILASMGMAQYRSSVVHAKEAVLKRICFSSATLASNYAGQEPVAEAARCAVSEGLPAESC
jgi:type II secretory pathway pseudopilin PulG